MSNNLNDSPLALAKDRVTIVELGARYFPAWRPGKSCVSPFREDHHPSFSVFDDGRRWKDFGTGEQGDAVDFLAKAKCIDRSAAAKELIALANTGTASAPVRRWIEKGTPAREPIKPMTADVATIWEESVEYLRRDTKTQQDIEEWRHWPTGTVRQLAEDGLIGCPILYGRRGVAFPVQAPFRDELGLVSSFDAGFHFRQKPPDKATKPVWFYRPNEKKDGIDTPALPFVLGAGFLPFAETVIVAEGQWDAITLCAAAGWLTSDAAWPERITVFATRGATPWRSLIDRWASYWPRDTNFILFADGDDAGATWKAPGGFKDALCKLGHAVRIVRPRQGGPKDLNDIHRVQPITIEVIEGWISERSHVA